jgi:hypothetical protein
MPDMKGTAMNDEDKILANLMKDAQPGYIMDDGFSQRVLEKLPPRRMSPISRRTALILGAVAISCPVAGVLAAPALTTLGVEMGNAILKHANIFSGTYAPYVYMAFALVAGLAAAWYVLGKDTLTEKI